MNIDGIVTRWALCKGRLASRRLVKPCSVEYEHQGKQWGHPSTFAYVRFECLPAEALSLEVSATWPADLMAACEAKVWRRTWSLPVTGMFAFFSIFSIQLRMYFGVSSEPSST